MRFRFGSIAPPSNLVFATLLAMHGCVDDTLNEVDGADGSADTSGTGGSAGASGTGGSAGTSGAGGVPGTCSAGVPPGNNCIQGTNSVGSVLHARDLSSLEGRVVKAAFAQEYVGGEVKITTTVVSGGAFDLDFLFVNTSCNIGNSTNAAGAFYIDANADGACDPAVDRMFVWGAYGGPSGTCREIEFTPQSPACKDLYYGTSAPALTVAQTICPAVGSCLSFCGRLDLGAGGTPEICADGGAVDASGS